MPILCPDEETLIDFLENRLTDRQRARIENHLTDCSDCRDQVGTWVELVQGDLLSTAAPVPPAVTRKAVNAVAQLVPESIPRRLLDRTRRWVTQGMAVIEQWTISGAAQPVALRGENATVSEHIVRRRKTFDGLDLSIEIEKCGDNQALIRVVGAEERPLAASIRVVLCKAQREVASMLLDDPPVVFEEIPFGSYALVFIRNGVKLGEYLFELAEAPQLDGKA